MTYRRVLLKLSGEALGGAEGGRGIDTDALSSFSRQIKSVMKGGLELAIVVGGGNILRGAEFASKGAKYGSADYMGMLATVINGLALSDALEGEGLETRVMSALEVNKAAEPFIKRRALRHLERKRVVILVGGLGTPNFTTDTAAASRAIELGCDVLLKATKVDGVYTADPVRDPEAKHLPKLEYMEVLTRRLGVMDGTAITLCMDHRLPVVVFDFFVEGNLERVLRGEALGTKIGP